MFQYQIQWKYSFEVTEIEFVSQKFLGSALKTEIMKFNGIIKSFMQWEYYKYIYIVIRNRSRQICFVQSELISMAWHTRFP